MSTSPVMRAMVFEEVSRPLRAVERPVPVPAPGQLLLRVRACGVCRTDLHLLDGEVPIASPPRILGHQIVGTVEGRGAGPAETGAGTGEHGVGGTSADAAGEGAPAVVGRRVGGTSADAAGEGAPAVVGRRVGGTSADAAGEGAPAVVGRRVGGTSADAAGEGAPAVVGRRVGVPWLGWTCGVCVYCRSGRENLCPRARFTGRDLDGGMAEYVVADERFCFDLPPGYPDEQAAPLLCAGLIGFRALSLCGNPHTLGLYGFGAAAHLLAQVARWQGRRVFAFTRPGDQAAQAFARELGAVWAGGSDEPPPEPLDAAILFAPVGALVPLALRAVAPGGVVVCGGIHMSDVPSFPYSDLWEERVLRSVANLTRLDAAEFLALAPRVPVRTQVTVYPLEEANRALEDLRAGRFVGAGVLTP